MSTAKNIFSQQSPALIRLFAHAGSPEKVLCVPMDYAKEKHVALCCNGLGMILKQSFPVNNTPEGVAYLLTVLENIRKKHFITKDHVILGGEECGTFADNFVHAVIGHGYPVYSVNAHRAKLHRENTKASTDSLDLLGIASVLLHRQGTLVRISDTEQLQFLARHRHGMVQESTALGNKIHALVDQLFPGFLCAEKSGIPSFCDASLELMSEAFSPKQLARRQLKTLADQLRRGGVQHPEQAAAQLKQYATTVLPPVPSRVDALQGVLADQARLLIVLRQAILRSETDIGNELARHEGALATSIRGTGIVLAAQLTGELGDLRGLRTAQLCSYAGIVPRVEQSGGPDKEPVIFGCPRSYNHLLKDTIMQLALHMGRHGPEEWMLDYARREGRQQNADFAIARRYLRTYLHLVRHGFIYMPEKLRAGDSSEKERAAYFLKSWPLLLRKWKRVGAAKAAFDIKNPLGIWRNCIENLYKINLPLQMKETKSEQVSEE